MNDIISSALMAQLQGYLPHLSNINTFLSISFLHFLDLPIRDNDIFKVKSGNTLNFGPTLTYNSKLILGENTTIKITGNYSYLFIDNFGNSSLYKLNDVLHLPSGRYWVIPVGSL